MSSTLGQLRAATSTAASGKTTAVSHQTAVWAVIGAGVIAIVLADYAPRLVNGLLLLILAGVVLKRSDVWIPWLNGVSKSFGSTQA